MNNSKRLDTVDMLRGLVVVSMIIYHLCWDLKNICGYSMSWYETYYSFLWQQSICYSFILIAGFCMYFARNPVRDGVFLFAVGAIITIVTFVAIPDDPIIFGILSMYGASKILVGAFVGRKGKEVSNKKKSFFVAGFVISLILFIVTRFINEQYLNLIFKRYYLPKSIFEITSPYEPVGMLLTYFGIMQKGFTSSDYFSVIPWIFLFLVGFFSYGLFKGSFSDKLFHLKIKPINFLGKHSLLIYLAHQPVLYAITFVIGLVR